MSSYRDRFPWFEPTPYRTTHKPPVPILHEEPRPAPRILYGPRGEILTALPRRLPFGPQPSRRAAP